MFMTLALLISSSEPEVDRLRLPSGQLCSFDPPSSKAEREREPAPGITLIPGLVTGMTKAEVKAFSSDLMKTRPYGAFHVAPGVRARATAGFSEKTQRLVSLELEGFTPERTYAALVQDFGPPQLRRPAGFLREPLYAPVHYPKDEDYKWCLGTREITFSKGEDEFRMWIDPSYPLGISN